MVRTCAYCDRSAVLTKEHVWPECFLKRRGRDAAHFSHKSGRVHGADYVVADVCSECNATRLSPLDAYFCRLYDAYFSEPRDFDSTVVFRFEFDTLVRALLKIAYNSARSAGSHVDYFFGFRSFILGLEGRPTQLAMFLELVSPSLIPDEAGGHKKLLPTMYRSAVTSLLTRAGQEVVTRIVAVNSFYFHLVLPRATTSATVFDEAVGDLGVLISGVVRLDPDVDEVVLRSSPQDGLRSIRPQLEAHAKQYREYFGRGGEEPGSKDGAR